MEDDDQILMENKLVEIFSKPEEDLVQKHERKMEVYRDMADQQIREILQTMRPYTNLNSLTSEQNTTFCSGSLD